MIKNYKPSSVYYSTIDCYIKDEVDKFYKTKNDLDLKKSTPNKDNILDYIKVFPIELLDTLNNIVDNLVEEDDYYGLSKTQQFRIAKAYNYISKLFIDPLMPINNEDRMMFIILINLKLNLVNSLRNQNSKY